MKKYLILVLSCFFILLLIGCNNESTLTTAKKPVSQQVLELDNPYNIALCITTNPKTSMGINFELGVEQDGFVEYWEKGKTSKMTLPAEKKVTDVNGVDIYLYEATMLDLTPGTTYEYQVFGNDEEKRSPVHQFSTEEPEKSETTFMVLSDPQGSDVIDYMTYANNVLNMMDYTDKNIRFALFTGDLINVDESRTQWNLFLKYSSAFSYRIPIAATTGNHETGSVYEEQIQSIEFQGYFNMPENGPYYQDFDAFAGDYRTPEFDQGKTYSFDYGFAHYVAIDSEIFNGDSGIGGLLDEENMTIFTEWLETDLAQHQDDWIIVYLHRGPYSITYDSVNVRTRLVPILEEYGVDLVFSGHDHRYSRTVIHAGTRVGFSTSDEYTRGKISLITDPVGTYHFNDYSSNLGVTYLVGTSSGVKFYGDTDATGTEIIYRFLEKSAVFPVVTVSETAIRVTSYVIEKSSELAIFPDQITVLEEFIIHR